MRDVDWNEDDTYIYDYTLEEKLQRLPSYNLFIILQIIYIHQKTTLPFSQWVLKDDLALEIVCEAQGNDFEEFDDFEEFETVMGAILEIDRLANL